MIYSETTIMHDGEYKQLPLPHTNETIKYPDYRMVIAFGHVHCIRNLLVEFQSHLFPEAAIIEDAHTWRESMIESQKWINMCKGMKVEELPQRVYEDRLLLSTVQELTTLIQEIPTTEVVDTALLEKEMMEILRFPLKKYVETFSDLKNASPQGLDGIHGYSKYVETDRLGAPKPLRTHFVSSTAILNSFGRFFRGEATREDFGIMTMHVAFTLFQHVENRYQI